MGEKKRKSRSRAQVLAGESRCIYCANPPNTLEHMPPIGMFRERLRPSGMEYAVCGDCNKGTRGSDAVAAFIARTHPSYSDDDWQFEEAYSRVSAIHEFAPGVIGDLFSPDKTKHEWIHHQGSGLLQRVVRINADGPHITAHLNVFGAKLAMALFREHVGVALPLSGAIWCQFALNGGMTQEALDARIKILPISGTLKQGKRHVGDQFRYRYNCDGRSVVAAVVQFHRSLWFTIFASSDQRIIELFCKPEFLQLPASTLVKPGRMLELLSSPDFVGMKK